MSKHKRLLAHVKYSLAAVVATASVISAPAQAGGHGNDAQWTTAVAIPEINSPAAEGCPIETEDGLSVMFASTRPGGLGGNDIWAADRNSIDSPWSAPRNVGEPINSAAADFCPTPTMGRFLFFVSERPGDGTGPAPCGGGDMYLSRQS